ncbi:SRPBCC family protein [uncultured Jatrophihabitans sp.]|uniref:SRPBCC family protein n=1 Tax=uncultured Jatrophihabitans sp. TaxID=1610747 RepID=UPI0035CC9803
MTKFQNTVKSDADISASREEVWKALTDPDLLPKLTPLLRDIHADGEIWCWQMMRIAALGVSVSPNFTEKMTFADGTRIEYTHTPPDGARERAGAEGRYELSDIEGGTHLSVELTLCVDLPLPKAAKPAVQRVMKATMDRTGDRFSKNLLDHLNAHEL